MGDIYRVIGAEESPYSVKVRTYFRYKDIPHRWMGRAAAGDLYQRHARLPLVPLVVTPDDRGIQDSTPIIEALEPEFPEPGIHPDEPLAAFVSALLEEFGDEWGNKWMFHFRWAREVDQIACGRRLAANMGGGLGVEELEAAARTVVERMVNRVWFVGSNAVTAPQIEQSFEDAIGILERHLVGRPYLFGGRPAFADFGLFAGAAMGMDANVLQWLPGARISWNLPGFIFLNTDFMMAVDGTDGLDGGSPPEQDSRFGIDINGLLPFSLGSQSFSITGHAEYFVATTDELGNDVPSSILAQPQLRWDIGGENGLFVGIEYQYWSNKLGTDVDESVVQMLGVWQF